MRFPVCSLITSIFSFMSFRTVIIVVLKQTICTVFFLLCREHISLFLQVPRSLELCLDIVDDTL